MERGIDVDRADMIAASIPFALLPPKQKALYDRIRKRDADFYEKLAATGFLLDFGPDETGLMMKAYRTGSGYYVDVGASQLIIDGEIKVKAGVEIDRLTPHGIRFADGSEVACDIIIQSTGFQSMHEVVARIVSRDVADEIGTCWGLGSERAAIRVRGTANCATCTSPSRSRTCGSRAATWRSRASSRNSSPFRSRRAWKGWRRRSIARG